MATVAAWATAIAAQEQSTTVNEERRKKKRKGNNQPRKSSASENISEETNVTKFNCGWVINIVLLLVARKKANQPFHSSWRLLRDRTFLLLHLLR